MQILSIVSSFALALALSVPAAAASSNLSVPESSSSSRRRAQETRPISFYGLNYNTRKGPDWAPDGNRCKSRAEVVRDLELLSRITTRIRLLSLVDCNQGALVWSVLTDELAYTNMEVWLGLWVGPEEHVFVDEYDALALMIPSITSVPNWESRLSGISVGSEAIYREDVTISEAIANLQTTKALLRIFGIQNKVPVAIVDIAPIYSNSRELRLASDTIMTNTFPFWEGLPIDSAIDELEIDLGWLLSLEESQGKNFVLSEHGWPSGGYLDGVGIASPENQKQYLQESYCYLKQKGWAYYWFTAIDNDWRQEQDPNNTIEGNWGFLDANLGLKDHFVDFEFSCDGDVVTYSFGAVDWSVEDLPTEPPIDPAFASCGLWQGCEALAGDCCPTPAGDLLGCCRSENFLGENNNNNSNNNNSNGSNSGSNTGQNSGAPGTGCNFCPGEVYNTVPIIDFSSGNDSVSCGGLQKLVRSGLSPTFCESERSIIEATCCGPAPPPPPPTFSPTKKPTALPTVSPTKAPVQASLTAQPTLYPTAFPTRSPRAPRTTPPTENPTQLPTVPPTANPTKSPIVSPITSSPTNATTSPTKFPTAGSTFSPPAPLTPLPTAAPTNVPTAGPTQSPTTPLTTLPTATPTKLPTNLPTKSPTVPFTSLPTATPTKLPTPMPTNSPTAMPTKVQTANPTKAPTASPTKLPTAGPTKSPTASPTKLPTNPPTVSPTKLPTLSPTDSLVKESAGEEDSSGIFPPEDEDLTVVFPWDATGGALPSNINSNENSSGCTWKSSILSAATMVSSSIFVLLLMLDWA